MGRGGIKALKEIWKIRASEFEGLLTQREVFLLMLSFEDFIIGEGRVIRAMTGFHP